MSTRDCCDDDTCGSSSSPAVELETLQCDCQYCDDETPAADATSQKQPRSWSRRALYWLSFLGPSWLVAVSYIDPGSIVADFQQGAYTGYQLLWITFVSIVIGCAFQNLSMRLGLATGKNLAQLCSEHYKSSSVNWIIWVLMEISTVLVDVQAVVGSAAAVSALMNLPFWAGCVVICVLSLAVVLMYQFHSKATVVFSAILVTGLVLCFMSNFFETAPPAQDVFRGWFLPTAQPYMAFTALGTLGALVMPNAIFLHSDSIIQHKFDQKASKTPIFWASFWEMVGTMTFAFVGNLMVVCVFAVTFYEADCSEQGLAAITPGNCEPMALSDGITGLASNYGIVFQSVFLVGLIGIGFVSMIAGTLAGQSITEGFVKIRLKFWQRLLLTRTITMIPTILISVLPGNGTDIASTLNAWMNVIIALLLPFALIPVVHFSNKDFMNGWKMHWMLHVSIWIVTWFIIFVNFYFMAGFFYLPDAFGSVDDFPDEPWFYSIIGALLVGYTYLLYLTLYENLNDFINAIVRAARDLVFK